VRIDRQGDKLVRVPDDPLQEKSHFPFVFEALSLPDGEVYVSEFGINHEDAAQEAAVPVFNMASPVVQAGQLRGVVVVRVAAAPFLQNFNAALPTPYGFYLSNRWGDFLVHPDATQTFGFDRGQRILIQESFPQVAALVDGRAEEAVLSQPGTDDEEARVFAFVRMPFGNADEGRFMVVGLSQPLAVVQGEVLDLGRSILKILLVLSVVGVALAAGVSRLVTQPLQAMVKAAQAFSRGEAHGALPVHRGDEVGELARSFQDMEQQISRQLAELNLSCDAMAHLALLEHAAVGPGAGAVASQRPQLRPAVCGPGRLQGHQRHARARRGRPGVAGRGPHHRRRCAAGGHRRPTGRRRVHGAVRKRGFRRGRAADRDQAAARLRAAARH